MTADDSAIPSDEARRFHNSHPECKISGLSVLQHEQLQRQDDLRSKQQGWLDFRVDSSFGKSLALDSSVMASSMSSSPTLCD